MANPMETAERIAAAIAVTSRALRPVATPYVGAFAAPVPPPELYPGNGRPRGYYVPVPPPPPFKVRGRRVPVLQGVSGGRQWTVTVLVSDASNTPVGPTLAVETYGRFARSDAVPVPYLPWGVATAQPSTGTGRSLLVRDAMNLVGRYARAAVGEAALLSGRLPVPVARPPVVAPMILEAADPAIRSWLDSPRFLELYAGWERRAGLGNARTGSSLPVFKILAEQVKLTTGIDEDVDPALHAQTIQEILAFVPEMEAAVTGRDPSGDPIPTITFTDPPGSAPDIRPAYRCPACGQLEILKLSSDPATGYVHKRTLRCGVDVFPPFPNRIRDVMGAAAGVVRR